MEKRFFLALLLTGAVMMLTPVLFPRPNVPAPVTNADTLAGARRPGKTEPSASTAAVSAVPRLTPTRAARIDSLQAVSAETVSVRTNVGSYVFSTLGATPIAVQADSYPALQGKGG